MKIRKFVLTHEDDLPILVGWLNSGFPYVLVGTSSNGRREAKLLGKKLTDFASDIGMTLDMTVYGRDGEDSIVPVICNAPFWDRLD